MKIMIVRHGDPDYEHDSLTEKGWREAELLGDRLSRLNIRDFYCSPLGRARATAQPTLKKLGREQDMEILSWLQEFRGKVIKPSDEHGSIPWNLMPQYWSRQPELFDRDKWLDHGLMRTGNVREIFEETARGMDALLAKYGYERISHGDDGPGYVFRCEKNTEDTIVLFCHFALGMAIISYMTGVALPLMWECFFLPTTSVTTFVTEERIKGEVFFKCMQMGDTSHLYAGGEPVSKSGLYLEVLEPERKGEVNAAR